MPRSVALDKFSRISKVFVDRDEEDHDHSLARRRKNRILVDCGAEVAQSYTLQLALITAVNLANRCFPGAIRVQIDDRAAATPALVFPSATRTLRAALASIIGHRGIRERWPRDEAKTMMLLGGTSGPDEAIRVTFDGWIAKTGPNALVPRLPERQFCTLAGVLAGAMAVAEAFLSFAKVAIDATHRSVALSLWRPDLDAAEREAIGRPVEFLPAQLWVLGLGHLGQAYLWALATLPYLTRESTNIILNDFDKVESANVETGALMKNENVGELKTCVCSAWLESIGFNTTIIERRFGPGFRCAPSEPQLALCGFDNNETRRALYDAGFGAVIDCGLGGLAENFDTLNIQTVPSSRSADEMWPTDGDSGSRAQRIATQNRAYGNLCGDDECGRVLLAGKAVAVPFVGSIAATFVLAEALRALHKGPLYSRLKLRLASQNRGFELIQPNGTPTLGTISFSNARMLQSQSSS